MRDGPGRAALKGLARALWWVDLGVARALARRRGEPGYALSGSCNGCGMCCEAPSMAVSRLIWSTRVIRALFVWWQLRVNRFELVRAERDGRVFVFRCGHFDPKTRACDSYSTRPGMCRDYPGGLLYQPFPELFDECSYSIVSTKDDRMRAALEGMNLSEDQRARLSRRLGLTREEE